MNHEGRSSLNPKQRSRGRGPNGGGGKKHGGGGGGGGIPNRNQVFDSNGPEGRIRGNAHQVLEKYLSLARDASSQGDRVAAENYYQHAEHYFRVINAQNQNNGRPRQQMPTPAEDQSMGAEGEDEGGGESQAARFRLRYRARGNSPTWSCRSSPPRADRTFPGHGPRAALSRNGPAFSACARRAARPRRCRGASALPGSR